MHDALLALVHVVELDAEVRAVLAQGVDLRGGNLVDDVQPALDRRRHIVIDRGDGAVGPAHLAPSQPQPFKRLRGSDLVQQLQIDVEQRRLALRLDDTCCSQTFSNSVFGVLLIQFPSAANYSFQLAQPDQSISVDVSRGICHDEAER